MEDLITGKTCLRATNKGPDHAQNMHGCTNGVADHELNTRLPAYQNYFPFPLSTRSPPYIRNPF